MMVETEQTPNPETLKFLPGKKVSEIGPIEFTLKDKNSYLVAICFIAIMLISKYAVF